MFFVLSGGTAYAVTQIDRNSVKSEHIVNGEVKGGDVKESTLSKVSDADELDGIANARTVVRNHTIV